MMKLNDLFKNTSYEDTLFSEEAILAVESAVFMKNVKNVLNTHKPQVSEN